jgi:hypothetical protein
MTQLFGKLFSMRSVPGFSLISNTRHRLRVKSESGKVVVKLLAALREGALALRRITMLRGVGATPLADGSSHRQGAIRTTMRKTYARRSTKDVMLDQ